MFGAIWRTLTGTQNKEECEASFRRGQQYVVDSVSGLPEEEIVAKIADIRIQADGTFNTTEHERQFDAGVEDECLRQLQYLGHP